MLSLDKPTLYMLAYFRQDICIINIKRIDSGVGPRAMIPGVIFTPKIMQL